MVNQYQHYNEILLTIAPYTYIFIVFFHDNVDQTAKVESSHY